MWSFVGSKDNKQWIWLAIDANTREIVGLYIGDRTRQSALTRSGNPYLQSIASVPSVTPTFGRRMSKCYQVNAIEQWAKKLVKLVGRDRNNP